MNNLLIGESGGPTAVINASLAGAIKCAMKHREVGEIYGMLNGLEGLLKGKIIDLRKNLKSSGDFELLTATPAMALGSCRYRLPNDDIRVYEKIRNIFHRYGIGYFFYIGGNDSMDTVKKISEYLSSVGDDIKCIGIPKTIDNDLCLTDHTPGFGSSAKFIATALSEIICDSAAYDMPSITVVEIMGRNAGWLTASSVLARRGKCTAPHLVYLPECPFDPESFLNKLRELQSSVKNVVVAVSEGIRFENGEYVAIRKKGKVKDSFGHRYLSGVGKYLEDLICSNFDCKVRSIELNVLQRSASHLRSGVDVSEAFEVGASAVKFAVEDGKTGAMVVIKRVSNYPYLSDYGYADIGKIANYERTVPKEWITPDGCDVTDDMVEYLKPLILGDAKNFTCNGIPNFFAFDKSNMVKIAF